MQSLIRAPCGRAAGSTIGKLILAHRREMPTFHQNDRDCAMKPRRRLYAAQASDDPSVVILVHGTFAGAKLDRGNKWWQAGSTTARQLQARLPKHVEVASDAMVFHWSGENSERARSKAAFDLLKFVEPLETQGIPYHLVGHSHGGSVIWNMLKLATIQHRSLERLRTWTTVGRDYSCLAWRSALRICF